MIYKSEIIGGVRFSARALYNLDLQKWNREAARRLTAIKAEFAKNRFNKFFEFNPRKFPLRPRPTFTEQKKLI